LFLVVVLKFSLCLGTISFDTLSRIISNTSINFALITAGLENKRDNVAEGCLNDEESPFGAIVSGYYDSMKAYLNSDLEAIKEKIVKVFGNALQFNATIRTATVHCDFSRLTLSLLLWLEFSVFLFLFPVHVVLGCAGVVVGLIFTLSWIILGWMMCCVCLPPNPQIAPRHFRFISDLRRKMQRLPSTDSFAEHFFTNVVEIGQIFEGIWVLPTFVGACCVTGYWASCTDCF
jgi:hypothetical protein